jgi:signal transduction histidine kinase
VSRQEHDLPRAARALAEIAHALAGADDATARIGATLNLLGQIVPYECCALLEVMPNGAGSELHMVPDAALDERESLRERLTALLRLIRDESDDKGGSGAPGPVLPRDRMHLAIPVMGLNQIIGLLFVEHAAEPLDEPYDEHSLRLLSIVAAQIGSYVTTVRLRQEEIDRARELGIALRRLQETDRRKDDFLALLGHELRNPIGAINNALRIIDEGVGDDKSRYHKLIDRQIRHLSRIVDDLLDASRVRLGKVALAREILDLRIVAERWCEAFGSSPPAQSHQITLELADAPVLIDGDPVRLEQTLSNLITNALKYTPPGGRITVGIEARGQEAVIQVRDSGIGMTPELLATVFDLFTQAEDSLSRSQGGLGLGLPLVRSLVEMHGGRVDGFSEGLGRGSQFVVRLPLAVGSVAADRSGPVRLSRGLASGLRVLVVEDNTDACEMLTEMLVLWGHHVEAAADGLVGVALATSQRFDVMLVDIGLPKLDGYEVARRLRGELATRTPMLIAMTGYGQPEDRRRALDAGFDVYMVKPINASELQERLARFEVRGG